MDYEQKYKEALAKARQLCEYPTSKPFVSDLQDLFTELKESEDERIRKEIIDYIKTGTYKKDWITWLEKQGEKPILSNSLTSEQRVEEAMRELEEKSVAYMEAHKETADDFIAVCRGEQKYADRVEPKFKNGQWIVWQDKCYKVNYSGCGYELVDQNGLSTSLEYGIIEENVHLWTMQDAKVGDVLSYRNGQWIFIFKEKIGKNCFSYHALHSNIQGLTISDTGFTLLNDAIIPATKEQRDLLFQKMKEAGYEWDAENKELMKIKNISDNKSTEWSDEENSIKRASLLLQKFYHDDELLLAEIRVAEREKDIDFFTATLGQFEMTCAWIKQESLKRKKP